ncbi:MAG TPA: hypothetical protein VMV81_01045 [Phycisphaerae bacterium]|nr:hypothetical protein [Phycisphaerae bacterium]
MPSSFRCTVLCFGALVLLTGAARAQTPVGTAFIYQGRLISGGSPASGNFAMVFSLFNAPTLGSQVGPTLTFDGAGGNPPPVSVANGLFTVQLDFGGGVFDGNSRWLEVAVEGETLAPRQEMTATPYSLRASDAQSCNTAVFASTAGYANAPWQTSGADIFFAGGNVGIGTATPAAPLDLAGTLKTNGILLPGGAGAGKVLTSDALGNGTWQNALGLTLPFSGSAPSSTSAFSVTNTSSTALTNGARFESLSSSGRGVFATAPGVGVFGQSTAAGYGVYGIATSTGIGTTYGVYGTSAAPSGYGVYGVTTAASGTTSYGVYGQSAVPDGYAIYGVNTNTSSSSKGVVGNGVYGVLGMGTIYGVYSLGQLGASGTKNFQIDHPLDPENKYLLHYCAEGPEPQNVYNGIVTLDVRGAAEIALPDYFAEINRDPRYALTPIGAAMPNLHIAREIINNSFLIDGGAPGKKVSWEVKAVRNDLWVRTRGAPTEIEKRGAERGKYQHPEFYGLPPERGVTYDPENDRRSPGPVSAPKPP